jgi:hypothetical protein
MIISPQYAIMFHFSLLCADDKKVEQISANSANHTPLAGIRLLSRKITNLFKRAYAVSEKTESGSSNMAFDKHIHGNSTSLAQQKSASMGKRVII